MITNKIDRNNITFNSNWISNAKQKNLTQCLTKNMKDKPESMQKIYKDGIDFINDKISKKDFLKKLYYDVEDVCKSSSKNIEDAEKLFLEDFSMFFDLYGFNQNKTTKKNIVKSLEFLG